MEQTHYIGDLNKDELLEELWNHATNYHNTLDETFDLNEAKKNMKNNYPEYVCGKIIMVDIYNTNFVSSKSYDKENGTGALENVINLMYRSTKYNNTHYIPKGTSLEHSNYFHNN